MTVLPIVAYFCARPFMVRVLVLYVAAPMLAGYYLVTLIAMMLR